MCVFATCGVLLCDEGLSAERLGARYPTGDTDQAALQVWRNKERKDNRDEGRNKENKIKK